LKVFEARNKDLINKIYQTINATKTQTQTQMKTTPDALKGPRPLFYDYDKLFGWNRRYHNNRAKIWRNPRDDKQQGLTTLKDSMKKYLMRWLRR